MLRPLTQMVACHIPLLLWKLTPPDPDMPLLPDISVISLAALHAHSHARNGQATEHVHAL